MRDYKKRISLFLTVIMLMLSFSPASAFAEVGQTADSNDTTVIHENVEALKQDSNAASWQTSFAGRCFNIPGG